MTDEIMSEVQAIKDAIGAKYGSDPQALFEEIKRGEARLQAAGVQVLPAPIAPGNMSSSALQRSRVAHR